MSAISVSLATSSCGLRTLIREGYCSSQLTSGGVRAVRILAVNDFSVERENDSLYRFNITDTNGEKTEFFVTLYSDTDGI